MMGRLVRRVVTGVSCAIAGLAALWTTLLVLSGGLDVTISGRAVTSHEPMRPLQIFGVALTIYFLFGGDARLMKWMRALAPRLQVSASSHASRFDYVVMACLAVFTLVAGLRYGSKAASGSDSYGYLAEAELFLRGNLKVAQPWVRDVPWPNATWTFSPLGFKPAPEPQVTIRGYRPSHDPTAIVPTYSPGLPMLLAGAKWLAGNAAMFWIVPLSGVALVLTTFGLGCRLGSPRMGTMAAFLVATSPPVISYTLAMMTDVPVAAAWTLAIWCLLGISIGSAIGGGIALAVAVLIRPNLIPLLAVIAVWLIWRIRSGAPQRWRHIARASLILGGAAAGMLGTALIFWLTYGSPLESGYGVTSGYFSLSYVWPNLRNYSHWLVESQTPLIWLGFAALCYPVQALWPRADRSAVIMSAVFVAANCVEFIVYLVGGDRGYLRFLLPSYPFLMLGISAVALWCARFSWRGAAPLVTAGTIVIGLLGVDFAARTGVFGQWSQAASMEVGTLAQRMTPENSVVLAMQHSGAIRYYGGRMTMRWDGLPPEWLDRAVAWLADRGVETYVLIDPEERDPVRARFAGQALAARFDEPPAVQLGDKLFYDLSTTRDHRLPAEVVPLVLQRGKSLPPAPMPELIWKPR